jgi:MFS family permease
MDDRPRPEPDADEDADTEASRSGDPDGSTRRLWLALIFAYVVIEAAGFGMRGAVLPHLESEFGVGPALLGLVAPAGTVGFVVVLLAVGAVSGRLDLRRTMFVGAAALGVGYLALGVAPTFVAFLAAMAVRGSLTGVFRGVDRPVLGHLFPDRRGRVFNVYDLVWAGGAALGPVVLLAAVRLGDWRYAYAALGLALVPVGATLARLDLPLGAGVEEPLSLSEARTVLRRPRVAGATAAMVCVGGLEGGVYTWLPTFAATHVPASLAGLSVSAFTLAYVPGRALWGGLAERTGYLRLVASLAVAAGPTLYVTFGVLSGPAVLAGIVALGLLWAGMFPTLLAYAVDTAPAYSGPVAALAAAGAYTGIAVVPALMGVVVGTGGAAAAMRTLVVPVGVAIVVLAATWWTASPADPDPGAESAAGPGTDPDR